MPLKKKYRLCASVAFYNATYFRTHKFKVVEDKEMILSLFENKDEKSLTFYELFYSEILKKDRTCEKDIMSKFAMSCEQLPSEIKKNNK